MKSLYEEHKEKRKFVYNQFSDYDNVGHGGAVDLGDNNFKKRKPIGLNKVNLISY
jgi:hypothetical protein